MVRTSLAALFGAGLALAGALVAPAAASAAADTAAPALSATATDMRYSAPDIRGGRTATNTVTVTNNGTDTVPVPMLVFPRNDRDSAQHSDWNDCPSLSGSVDRIVCYLDPLAPGEQRTVSLLWTTGRHEQPGTARVRVAEARAVHGNAIPGTASVTRWKVTLAPITGTFDIAATDAVFPQGEGERRASTIVTLTNLTGETVPYPKVTFLPWVGDAAHTEWHDCVRASGYPDGTYTCVAEPLAAGESRDLTFPFFVVGESHDYSVSVRVDAATGLDGTVVPDTGAGTGFGMIFGNEH